MEPRKIATSFETGATWERTCHYRAGYVDINVKMGLGFGLLWLLNVYLEGIHCQGVYGKRAALMNVLPQGIIGVPP